MKTIYKMRYQKFPLNQLFGISFPNPKSTCLTLIDPVLPIISSYKRLPPMNTGVSIDIAIILL